MIEKMKNTALFIKDHLEVLIGLRDRLTPPKRLVNINAGDNVKIGQEFFKYFVEIGGLNPSDDVLDLGCGFGRMAVPLTTYLNADGSYQGLDILKNGIEWCSKSFTPKYPNFHFQHINVYNKRYNPSGTISAAGYKIPFPNESFDFVILTSVFTHMYDKEVENYLSEISRVLRSGGTSLITYFILNETSREMIKQDSSSFQFLHNIDNNYIQDLTKPEYAIAFNESYIGELYQLNKLSIKEPIKYGGWSGRKDYLSFQDIVIASK